MESDNHKNIQLIDKYLAGTLSKEETLLFEKKLKDPEFKKEFTQMQQLKAGITTFELRRIKNILQEDEQEIHDQNKNENSPIKTINRSHNILKIAAILIGISLGIWWISSQFSNNQQNYLAGYFTPQTNNLVSVDRSSPDSSLLNQTFSYYEDGAFEKFLINIKPFIDKENNDNYRFYQANALLATNQIDQAINILELIIQKNESQYSELSIWLLALSYLQNEQYNKARPLLEALKSVPEYRSDIEAILKGLD